MEFSFSLKIQTTKEEAWEYYANIEKWYAWEEDLKNITLKGNFETGSKGIMELEGMPPMEYELTHVKVFEEFWDKTATPFGDILFGHQIIDNNDGSVIIKHSVSLDSEYKKDSEKSTGLLFMRAYNKWHFMIKQELKKINLTHPQFVVLAALAYLLQTENEVTQVMISKLSGIDVMTVSQILSLLEKKDFVKRQEHSRDTRAKAVILNEKAEIVLKEAVPKIEHIDEIFFGKLGNDEDTFKYYLGRLNEE